MSVEPLTGADITPMGEYRTGRRNLTDPLEHIAATILDQYRSGWSIRPAARFSITYPAVVTIDAWYAARRNPRRYNVIVILMESMRADQLRAYGGTRDVMPVVDSLARDSRVYALAHTTATHTNYAAPSVLSSQWPLRSTEYYTYPEALAFPHVFLYDLLKRAGYRTGFFSSDAESWGGKINYWHLRTLDRFVDASHSTGPRSNTNDAWWAQHHMPALLDDAATVHQAVQWLDSAGAAPFFLYLALQNSHAPYPRPASFPARFGSGQVTEVPLRFGGIMPGALQAVRDQYANSLAYDDVQLATLFAYLKQTGKWNSTILVFTSDHGEAFNEHGLALHGNSLYEEQLHIPLLIRAPGLRTGVDSTPASLVDVPPTVLALLGLPSHPAFQGEDLRGASRCRPVYVVVQTEGADQNGVLQGGWKLIHDVETERYLLFDLASDPAERHDRSGDAPFRRRDLAEALQTWRWAQLHYYDTPQLRLRRYAPIITGPVAVGDDAARVGCTEDRVRQKPVG